MNFSYDEKNRPYAEIELLPYGNNEISIYNPMQFDFKKDLEYYHSVISDDDYFYFIQKNPEKYISKFRKGSNFGWNWGALLLGPFWFAYRKMYVHFLVALLLFFIWPFGNIFLALKADKMYREKAERIIQRVKDAGYDDPRVRTVEIVKSGGTIF